MKYFCRTSFLKKQVEDFLMNGFLVKDSWNK